ncbi:MAG TPA: BamA/TamA family outer membrane protein [Longimicrobiales bacterium]|nr:BamA/TamA family outer membrane protein [Longimicrobiales bacterium]
MKYLIVIAVALAAAPLAAQQSSSPIVEQVPGAQYQAGGLKEFVLGENWRDLWVRPLRLPVLDVDTFGGGLEMERQGGGNQSITLHMVDAQGKGWVFRSLDKYPERQLPGDLQGAPAGRVVEDQVSSMHPGGHHAVPRLLEALGILHVAPTLYVMGDSPRLGEFRETFAGMIGNLEEKPNEGPDDTPGFAGSTKIKGSWNFLDDLEDSPEHRLDEREYLRARLVDFLVNDMDRGTDQWRWARFGEKGSYVYRPLPRDRDWTFINADGLLARAVRTVFPKFVPFEPKYAKLEAFKISSHLLDRRLLTRVTRSEFEAEVADVQRTLTDELIAAAVADMPDALLPGHGPELTAILRARRDGLDEIAAQWYAWLAKEPDLRATDEDDVVGLEHQPDGSLRVVMATRAAPETPYYDRTFTPDETHEVRVYLHGGDDHVLVTGVPHHIRTVVVGGGGDDVLEDATGAARFYDDRGENEFRTSGGTYVSTKPWESPPVPEGLRLGRDWAPDYGSSRGLGPAWEYGEGSGVALGVSHTYTNYGFRRLPYGVRATTSVLYALGSGGFGGTVSVDYRGENTRRGLSLDARATTFDAFRFYGYGNDTPELSTDVSLVMLDRVRAYPALVWHLGPRPGAPTDDAAEGSEEEEGSGAEEGGADDDEPQPEPAFIPVRQRLTGRVTIGPVVQWTQANPRAGSPYADVVPTDGFGQVGAQLGFEIEHTDRPAAPRRGFAASASLAGYPAAWDVEDAFGTLTATAAGYVPLLGETHLALRAGGTHVLGDRFPAWDAAFIGGRTTVRGFEYQRFAGESAAFGGAELRVPIDTVQIFFNGELGIYGLADAGRVWQDDVSEGSWHTSAGGGVWFATMNRSISLTYARGERGLWYLWFGLPF